MGSQLLEDHLPVGDDFRKCTCERNARGCAAVKQSRRCAVIRAGWARELMHFSDVVRRNRGPREDAFGRVQL